MDYANAISFDPYDGFIAPKSGVIYIAGNLFINNISIMNGLNGNKNSGFWIDDFGFVPDGDYRVNIIPIGKGNKLLWRAHTKIVFVPYK